MGLSASASLADPTHAARAILHCAWGPAHSAFEARDAPCLGSVPAEERLHGSSAEPTSTKEPRLHHSSSSLPFGGREGVLDDRRQLLVVAPLPRELVLEVLHLLGGLPDLRLRPGRPVRPLLDKRGHDRLERAVILAEGPELGRSVDSRGFPVVRPGRRGTRRPSPGRRRACDGGVGEVL